MKNVSVLTGAVGLRPGRLLQGTDVQFFAVRYDDERPVSARPDNTGLPATHVDVTVNSLGATLVGAYPTKAGELDALLWVVGQSGDWYGQSHRAGAFAAEIGHRWTGVPGRPWIRAGLGRASGDRDPRDDRHGAFFQVLPTGRRYSLSATYAFMNLTDVFVQALLRPMPSLGLRADLRRVALADSADRWYAGSGATQSSGSFFGYGTRSSQGATTLGTVVEGSADYTVTRRWSINGYVGFIRGGAIVRRTFRGGPLVFTYVENVLQF